MDLGSATARLPDADDSADRPGIGRRNEQAIWTSLKRFLEAGDPSGAELKLPGPGFRHVFPLAIEGALQQSATASEVV